MFLQRQQALQVVRRSENIDVGQGSAHSGRYRLVVLQTQQWVQPNELADASLHVAQLRSQCTGLSRVPTVAQDHEHRVAGPQLPAVMLVEFSKRPTDVGAARPSRRLLRQGL